MDEIDKKSQKLEQGEQIDSLEHPEDVVTNSMSQLPFENLIGGPLSACVLAQRQAAETTKDFIENVGFKKKGNSDDLEVISMSFVFQQNGMYKKLNVPLLTIIPIPYMTIDSIDIGFRADMVATKDGKLYGKFSNAKDSVAVKSSKYDIRNQIDVNIHASSSSMPPGMAALLDIFGNQCIQINDLSDDEIDSYDQSTRDKLMKKKQEINDYAEQEAKRIEDQGNKMLEDIMNEEYHTSDAGHNVEKPQTEQFAVRLIDAPTNTQLGKVIAAVINNCSSQKLDEAQILHSLRSNRNMTVVSGISQKEAFEIEAAVDATGCNAKVVKL